MGRRFARLAALGISIALVALNALAAGAGTPDEGGRFWDDDGSTHESNIEAIAAIEVTLGCVQEGTAYCPDLAVTRAQMASFLARALNLAEVGTNSFSDVSDQNVHVGNINAIRAEGITLGCNSDGTNFCPNEFVSRAQMASFLARALGLAEVSSGNFEDIAGWDAHAGNINAIAVEGITLGCTADGLFFCPGNLVSRAQMASFMARALELTPIAVAPRFDIFALATCDDTSCEGNGSFNGGSRFFIRHGFTFDSTDPDYDELRTDPTTGFVLFMDDDELPSTAVTSTFATTLTRWDIIDFPAGLSGVHEFELQWVRLGEVVQDAIITVDFG